MRLRNTEESGLLYVVAFFPRNMYLSNIYAATFWLSQRFVSLACLDLQSANFLVRDFLKPLHVEPVKFASASRPLIPG